MTDGSTPAVALDEWLTQLARVEVHEVTVTVSPRRPSTLQNPLGAVVRGLLGESLHRRLSAEDFARAFEGVDDGNTPRPYWLRGLHMHPGFELRDRLTVTLSLLSSEAGLLDAFTAALQDALATLGDVSRPPNVLTVPERRSVRLASDHGAIGAVGAVLITARSPLSLRGGEDEGARMCPGSPVFGQVLRAGARRLGALQRAVDPTALRARLQWPELGWVTAREDTLVGWSATRFTQAQERRTPLSGLAGDLLIEGGDFAAVLPLLRAMERTSVGRKTAFGLGELSVDVVG